MYRYSYLALIAAVLVSGCTTTSFGDKINDKTQVRVIQGVAYPQLPDIPLPANPGYSNVTFDYPRDRSKPKVIKNTVECTNVPVDKQDGEFRNKCLEYPIDSNSNLYIGMSLEDWKNFLINQAKSDAVIQQYRNRIEEINKERAEWRNLDSKQK